ncbi:NAD(P)-dependent oxidoreductase [Roseospira marina]|uniref:NAD(P)-dependent oxidoreductase n=1 Tax=Roseospira marina TaxID=140057 RepID=A0A5M6I956_9PROT|nr:NAD(P)-dependent oxidoreductase [Roseospira marina]KAA5604269.1 NAD(P)-dependent oxidoreductase [Roseospira marina]MBB4315576.1 nucleoside-diphosphate-sugar epimerase [Roseospira marina]MBB5088572.1 nucleoside-diphosphate-sugar epimerase [Roseospira marina]
MSGMTRQPQRIIVTGGSGRLGKTIATAARRAGAHVVSCDRVPAPNAVTADIRDLQRLASLFDGADCVIHCAGLHAPHVGVQPDAEFRDINVEGTATVLRAMRQVGVPSLVFTSTTALLGGGAQPGQPARWIDDTTAPYPRSIYHETKMAAENLVRSECGASLSASILRLGRCFKEAPDIMAIHRLSRGIDPRDAAMAHLRAARFVAQEPEPLIVSCSTPFHHADCAALGCEADKLIRNRCPTLARNFDALAWRLPATIDRVYDSRLAQGRWAWRPRFGAQSIVARWLRP